MREIPDSGSFDAALCLGNSFGYLDIEGTREFVAALARAVRPGGGLVIDFNCTAETVLPGFTGEPRTMRTGDIVVEATTEYDVAGSRLISHYAYTRGDRPTQHHRDPPHLHQRAHRAVAVRRRVRRHPAVRRAGRFAVRVGFEQAAADCPTRVAERRGASRARDAREAPSPLHYWAWYHFGII